MSTCVIIPNWNGEELLKICLPSLIKQNFNDFEVIIVDNGSTDGSVSYIENNFPDFKIIKNKKNLGFAAAVNQGIKNSKSRYIALINNDTELEKSCLYYLVQSAKVHSEVGFVAAKMLNFYKRDIIDSAGDYIDIVGHGNNIGLGEKDGPKFNKAEYVFLVTGGGSLFKREVFDKVGFFDEDYFAYFEDADLCFRAQLAGFKGWFEPKARIYHIHKATASKLGPFVEYLQFRNMTLTVIKDFPSSLLRNNFNWLKIILVNVNTFRYLAFQGFLWQAILAEFYILANLPKLLRRRVTIQRSREVNDQYIIENVRPKKIKFFN